MRVWKEVEVNELEIAREEETLYIKVLDYNKGRFMVVSLLGNGLKALVIEALKALKMDIENEVREKEEELRRLENAIGSVQRALWLEGVEKERRISEIKAEMEKVRKVVEKQKQILQKINELLVLLEQELVESE